MLLRWRENSLAIWLNSLLTQVVDNAFSLAHTAITTMQLLPDCSVCAGWHSGCCVVQGCAPCTKRLLISSVQELHTAPGVLLFSSACLCSFRRLSSSSSFFSAKSHPCHAKLSSPWPSQLPQVLAATRHAIEMTHSLQPHCFLVLVSSVHTAGLRVPFRV